MAYQLPKEIIFESMREGFARGLMIAGKSNLKIMALTADLKESTRVNDFADSYPHRFVECGVAEQNMIGIAAGLALCGKIPYITSYAVFNPGRNLDQIRTAVYSNLNLKIVGNHVGLGTGPDGATHQALEDIAIMRTLPNILVVSPCDAVQAQYATVEVAKHKGPVYFRLERHQAPILTDQKTPFTIGKAQIMIIGSEVSIIACGSVLYQALLAQKCLKKIGINAEIINLHTIKPLDEATIINSAKKTKFVVTLENHQIAGGMGSSIAELLGEKCPTKIIRLGVKDKFAESGDPEDLYKKYGLDAEAIIKTICIIRKPKKVRRRK